jgi:hypothetical protein
MTLLGFVSILLGLLSAKFAMIERTRLHVYAFAALYVLHLAATFVYYSYVQSEGGDSQLYYYDELDFYNRAFALGTGTLIYFVQFLRGLIGGTYLDYFMMFHAIGFCGIAVLMRTFEEVYLGLGTDKRPFVLLLLFLPSMQFWTAAIGKDAPLFFAACLCLWAMINVRKRWIAMGAAIALMVLVRPHIALVALVALAVALLLDKSFSRWTRSGMMAVAVVAGFLAVATIQSAFNLDLTDADSISVFLEARDSVSRSAAGGNTSVQGSFAVRLFSLLFRPFFIDVEELFGYIASVENGFLMIIFATLLIRLPTLVTLFRHSAFVRFALAFSVGIAVVLALSYYNVGLGLRQRTMLLPALLALFVTVLAVRAEPREDFRAALA